MEPSKALWRRVWRRLDFTTTAVNGGCAVGDRDAQIRAR